MPRIMFDKPQETDNQWKPLPAGTYDLQIDEVEPRTTKNGNQQLMIKCHVVNGDYDSKKCTLFYVLAASSVWRFKNLLDAIGIVPEEDADGLAIDYGDLVGAYFTVDASIRQWEGKDQNDFKKERASALSAAPAPAPQTQAAMQQAAPRAANPPAARAAAPVAQQTMQAAPQGQVPAARRTRQV